MKKEILELSVALQSIQENELSKNVIIPLLQALGYKNVEFYGGVREEGKDIVFWEESKFEGLKLIVAQVKHFKLTNVASDSKSFQTIINQLVMCFEKPLVFSDQRTYLPSEAVLISSYQLDVKTLQTRFSEQVNLRSKHVEIIDGVKLAELLAKHLPDLSNKLLGKEVNFKNHFISDLNNKTVLKALGFHDHIALKNIYTDVDFSLGKNTTKLFFTSDLKGSQKDYQIEENKWKDLCLVVNSTRNKIGFDVISPAIKEVEKIYLTKLEYHKEWKENIELLKKTFAIQLKDIKNKRLALDPIRTEVAILNIEKNKLSAKEKLIPSEKKELRDIQEKLHPKESRLKELLRDEEKLESFRNDINEIEENEPLVDYSFTLNGAKISHVLNESRGLIVDKVNLFNRTKPNTTELKGFIEECRDVINSSSVLFSNELISENILSSNEKYLTSEKLKNTRLKLPVEDIFDTGVSTVLLGEAGAGKTTCLQIYALNRTETDEKLIIWAPLSQVIPYCRLADSTISANPSEIKINLISGFVNAIHEYLVSKSIDITNEDFIAILNERKCVFLLDGLDEVIKNNPWLPKAINHLEQQFELLQIIVTSRMSGDYIDELHFFTVTLLPFTSQQRDEFISRWFGPKDQAIVKNIKEHLNTNKVIGEIVKNPLLTTTLCVLAKHRLPLPQTEIKLYNDRLRLLTGYYDNVKNIDTRVTITPQNLELLAQKLAFHLHSINLRGMNKDLLIEAAKKLMQGHLSEDEAKVALLELIDPCNIIVPVTSEGDFGFGHLRYQEHLAAIELKTNRSIDVEKFLTNIWWRDTLILFARMSESLEWLIAKVSYQIRIPKVSETINEMILTRPLNEQIILKRNIEELLIEGDELFNLENDSF